jgi:hypothetical protein
LLNRPSRSPTYRQNHVGSQVHQLLCIRSATVGIVVPPSLLAIADEVIE